MEDECKFANSEQCNFTITADMKLWLEQHAKDEKFKSVPELMRHIVREYYKQQTQRQTTALAA